MELTLQLDAQSDLPLHQQIYDQLRDAILTGKLRSRQRLPASRYLAQTLSVSRTTITQSYDQLISEGYLETRPGAGTFVCAQLPDDLLEAYCPPTAHQHSEAQLSLESLPLSAYGDRLVHTSDRVFKPKTDLSFTYGVPALDLFPLKLWRQLCSRRAAQSTDWMDYHGDLMGYRPLREEISAYISQVRAIRCQPEQILITNGTQQALSLIVHLLVNSTRRESIAIENPGYLSAKRIFASSGAPLVPIPIDAEGMVIDGPNGLRSLSAHHLIKLVYVTPSHQFPTGVLMPLSRRLALLQWAQENSAIIIEDDYDSEFRYSGRPTPALQGLDSYGQVLYVGTFSKVMFPGLRLGYVVLPPALIPIFRRSKWLQDRQGSILDQQALTDFIAKGHLTKHIRRMRSIYAERRSALVRGLQEISASAQQGAASVLGDESGLHVMAQLPITQSDTRTIEQAKQQGVTLFSAQEQYWAKDPKTQRQSSIQSGIQSGTFIFGFGNISEPDIKEALQRIQISLHKLRKS